MSESAKCVQEAARLLRVADGRLPGTPAVVALAAAAAGLLGIAAHGVPVQAAAADQGVVAPAVADPPRSWWQRLFGTRR